MIRTGALALTLLFSALALACTASAEAEAADKTATRTSLVGSFTSQRALVDATLDALKRGDDDALRTVLITREEWETLLWPEMPDGEYTDFEFVWGLSSANSRKGRAQALSEYGGLGFELVDITYTKEPEVYPSFTLHKGARVRVRRPDTGEEGVIPIFDVFLDYGGHWKLMNYDEL